MKLMNALLLAFRCSALLMETKSQGKTTGFETCANALSSSLKALSNQLLLSVSKTLTDSLENQSMTS